MTADEPFGRVEDPQLSGVGSGTHGVDVDFELLDLVLEVLRRAGWLGNQTVSTKSRKVILPRAGSSHVAVSRGSLASPRHCRLLEALPCS